MLHIWNSLVLIVPYMTKSNELSELSRTEFSLIRSYNREQRIERVETRLKKVEVFINYLLSQQQVERERFSVSIDFADRLYESFKEQSEKVLQSARSKNKKSSIEGIFL